MAQRRDRGFLLPPWFVYAPPAPQRETDAASLLLGGSLALALFALARGARQTAAIRRRHRLCSTYLFLVWATWLSSLAMAVSSWLYVEEMVPPSFWIFLAYMVFWIFQVNCVLQIVANRVSFLIFRSGHARWLRMGILAITAMITATGAATWLPGVMQLTPGLVAFNYEWDRATKGVFAATDLGLNVLFLRLVWKKLIAAGLTKYWTLFRVNCCLTFLSVSLDVGLIGIESTASPKLYLCFNPLVFLGKLHIELGMAEMLARVVRSTNPLNTVPVLSRPMDEGQRDEVIMILGGRRLTDGPAAMAPGWVELRDL